MKRIFNRKFISTNEAIAVPVVSHDCMLFLNNYVLLRLSACTQMLYSKPVQFLLLILLKKMSYSCNLLCVSLAAMWENHIQRLAQQSPDFL